MGFLRTTLALGLASCAFFCAVPSRAAEPAMPASAAAAAADLVVTPGFAGDSPEKVRDALARIPRNNSPRTISSRIKDLVATVIPKTFKNPALTEANLGREFAFVVPVLQGVRYRTKAQVMTVDTGVSDSDHPEAILLDKTVKGPRGRNLVVAAEARAKGYIQTVDLIELDAAGKHAKTTVQGRFPLSHQAFEAGKGDLSIVFLCQFVPPYLTDERDHADPTDDEPTDITTRTSTLHARVDDIWLINRDKGIVLAKGLHLAQ
jgi:hypothetical protein